MRNEISAPDRARLDAFTDNVREIERRLQIAASATTAAPEDFAVPPGIPQSFDQHIKLMFDLLVLGFQADITRVGTMLFARDLTGRVYPESASPTLGFHGGSHHGEDPNLINQLSKINQYHVKMLAYFVDKLAKTPTMATARCSTIRCCCTAATWATRTSTCTTTCRTSWSAATTAS